MAPDLLALPGKVLASILQYVMNSDEPMHLSFFLNCAAIERPAGGNAWYMLPSCRPVPQRMLGDPVNRQSSDRLVCKCSGPILYLEDQHSHQIAWVTANSVSRGFRSFAKEAFFSEKVFSITPKLLNRLLDGEVKNFSHQNTQSLFKYARRVTAPMGVASNATLFLGFPRYQRFESLRVLAIRIDMDLYEKVEREQISAPEEFKRLLGGIGFKVDEIEVRIIRSVDERHWSPEWKKWEEKVFPYLRWVGTNKAKARKRPNDDLS